MSEPFIGEVRVFPYTFTPVGWLRCNGQAVSIQQYQVLYAVIGTTYGTGPSGTFKLPNMTNSAVFGAGNGPGLTPRVPGATAGADTVTLTQNQIPPHNHTLNTCSMLGTSTTPANQYIGHYATNAIYKDAPDPTTLVAMAANSLAGAGAGGPHENRQPALAAPFFIAFDGIYPSRN